MAKVTTSNYDIQNAQNTKEPVIILEIEGLPFRFSSNTVYTKIRYDDPGVYYDGTYVYDGLRPISSDLMKSYIDRKGSFSTISQKLEQWDGKSSVETLSIKLVDVGGLVTQVITPGSIIEEILNRRVKVYFGYQDISFPEDYIRLFTGYINSYKAMQGSVLLQFTDPSSKRKQAIFNSSVSTLTAPITNSDTTINLSSTSNLYQTITDALGNVDAGVTIGLRIEDEIIYYENADIVSGTQLQNVTRGARNTTAAAHDAGTEVECFISFSDNPINIALKVMLSGFNGSWIEDLELRGIVNTDNGGTAPDTITFGQTVDLSRDYGIVAGDFITLSGSSIPTNNDLFTVESIDNDGRTVTVVEKGILLQENPPISGFLTTVAAFRSKYDVYPTTAGLRLTPDDVFVSAHESIRDTFIQFEFDDLPVIGEDKSGKTWIETNLFKTIGAYSLTQGSRISMGLTRPPLVDDLTRILDPSNVIRPTEITVERGMNTRFFYNVIRFKYAWDPIADDYKKTLEIINASAATRMRQISVLEIEVKGLNDSLESETILTQRAARLDQRYQYSAETVELRTNFGTGHLVDAGDIAILSDTNPPLLQITNTTSGSRGIENRVMEVQERTINISDATTRIRLLSNNGFDVTDRYGVIGPSSLVDGTYANTTTKLRIKSSFYSIYGTQEFKKWSDYPGHFLVIHDDNWTYQGTFQFAFDDSDPNIMTVTPALPFIPSNDDIIELAEYDATDPDVNSRAKAVHPALNPSGLIFSGSSQTVFTLDSGEAIKFKIGQAVYIQKPNGTTSPDLKIIDLVGDVVTLGSVTPGGSVNQIGFIPASGDRMELAGFKDGGAGYRFI